MSWFNFSKSKKIDSKYHQYETSRTDEERKIDGIISMSNRDGLSRLFAHNIKLKTNQVYQVLLGNGKNSFIYKFNESLFSYFVENHAPEIRIVLKNMAEEIITELAIKEYAVFKSGFAIAPDEAVQHYEDLHVLGNFLSFPLLRKVIIQDTFYASDLCQNLNDLILNIESKIQEIANKNRNISFRTAGILEEIQQYNQEVLSETIREIFKETQHNDVVSIINEYTGGKNSAQKIKIIERLSKAVQDFDISELPQDVQACYEDIKVLISDLEPHRENLNDDALMLYKKLVDERLPEVLEQYIILPKRFLETYKDLPDSPQKLLLGSFQSMQKALNEIHTSYFNKQLLDLHATKIYMEAMTQN